MQLFGYGEQYKPGIFNSDQGYQFTSQAFTKRLLDEDIRISMDGRGRAFDNIFVERLWRSLKYEEVYLNDYGSVLEATRGISRWFEFYNRERPHQNLGYRIPYEAFIKVPQASLHFHPSFGAISLKDRFFCPKNGDHLATNTERPHQALGCKPPVFLTRFRN